MKKYGQMCYLSKLTVHNEEDCEQISGQNR